MSRMWSYEMQLNPSGKIEYTLFLDCGSKTAFDRLKIPIRQNKQAPESETIQSAHPSDLCYIYQA